MVDAGLVEEVRSLLPYRHLPALQTVGYKEIFAWFDWTDGRCVESHAVAGGRNTDGPVTSLERAIELIQRNTRHYARKQLSYWRRDKDIRWMDIREVLK